MASEAVRHYGNPAESAAQRAQAVPNDASEESYAFHALTVALGFYLLIAVVLLRAIYRLSRRSR
jgi:hypothetical protein